MRTELRNANRKPNFEPSNVGSTNLLAMLLGCVVALSMGCRQQTLETPEVELRGAGSTFPAPLYQRWFTHIGDQDSELSITYDEVGSGAGVRQFVDEFVDFAGSDDPLTDEEIAQVDRGVCQIPLTSGAIVLAYNLRDSQGKPIPKLRLSRAAYSGIFLGNIRSWLDEEIVRHNPDVQLPDLPIQVEYRLDSSGTTAALTRHLSAVSSEWRDGPGIGKRIEWPVGAGMPGHRGLARGLRQVPGSIGYMSFTQAAMDKVTVAALENRSGKFIEPTLESIQIGLSGSGNSVRAARDFVSEPPAENAYPIVAYTWILCYRVYNDPEKLAMLQKLLSYALGEGQQLAAPLGYVALSTEIALDAEEHLSSMTLPQSADTATSIVVAPDPSEDEIEAVAEQIIQEAEVAIGQEIPDRPTPTVDAEATPAAAVDLDADDIAVPSNIDSENSDEPDFTDSEATDPETQSLENEAP